MEQPTTEKLNRQLRTAAVEFGRGLRRWRVLQGWAQDTAMDWGRESGIPHVYSSQWSQLETAVMQRPAPSTFYALGLMNKLIAERDFRGVVTRALRDRLEQAEPIRHEDGRPWRGEDFFAAFIGRLQWPDLPDPEAYPPFTDQETEQWSTQIRDWFQQVVKATGLSRHVAAGALLDQVPAEHVEALERVLFGGAFTPAELDAMRGAQGEPLPAEWLRQWAAAEGMTTKLRKGARLWSALPDQK